MQKSSKKIKFDHLGHYQIIEEIGHGGMAVVYKGIQPSLNRTVAIKVLPESFARDKEFIERFDREAETIARLSHPNIIQIIDRGREEGICYFVMEYVDGLNLDRLLRERALTFRQTLEISVQVCRALSYAHSKGIVHRDLKPSNILVAKETFSVKVADFGLVQLAQAAGELSTLTQSNIAMGTLEYMAPEQRRDARAVDSRADIFSFGIILYEMFTGQLPMGHFKRPSEINPQVPREIDEVVLRCLKPNPDDRYQKAGELGQVIEKFLRQDSGFLDNIVRKVRTARERASTALRRKPRRSLFGAGGILLAIILLAVFRSCGKKEGGAPAPPQPGVVAPAAVVIPPTQTATPQPTATRIPTATPAPRAAIAVPSPTVAGKAEPSPKASPELKTPGATGPEADLNKAESYAAADMKSVNLRQYAVTSMRSVMEKYKESAPAWAEKAQMRIGQIYEQAGEIDLALAEYRRLLQLFSAGSLRAEAQFRIAECLKPSGFWSGLDYKRTEKRARAIEEYRKAYKEYPASPQAPKARFQMGLLQEEENTQESYEAALSSFDTISREYAASELAPHAMLKVALLCQSKKIHDYERTIKTYEDILSRYPDHEEEFHILLSIASVIEAQPGEREKAIEAYRRVIREKPTTNDALEANRRIEKLLQMGQPSQ